MESPSKAKGVKVKVTEEVRDYAVEKHVTRPDDNAFAGEGWRGMTKREYIATQLMGALLLDFKNDWTASFKAIQAAEELIKQLNATEVAETKGV